MQKRLVNVSLDDAYFLLEFHSIVSFGIGIDAVFKSMDQSVQRILFQEKSWMKNQTVQIRIEDAQKLCEVLNNYLVLHPCVSKDVYAAFGRLAEAVVQAKKNNKGEQ